MNAAEHDVVILGAGPAGTSAAIRLAQMGLDVGIVERRNFPRGHVGICLPDETVALIDYLGLGGEFDAAQFWRRNLTAVRWGDSETRLVAQTGYHVDRAILDGLMLCKARSMGVRIYQPVQFQGAERLEDSLWAVTIASDEQRQVLKARFIVDAAGRRPSLPGPRIKDGPPLLALHANWLLKETAGFDGLIAAGEDAWLWYAQTARDRAVVSVFFDPGGGLAASERGGVQARYADLLRQFCALGLERLGAQCSSPRACDATSHHAENPVGDHFIRLGDACFSVDPLSSQGVHLALQSGLQGAVVVNTVLRKPENTKAAQQFFRQRIAARIDRYIARTKQEYARMSAICPNAFWRERAGDASGVEARGLYPSPNPTPLAPADQVALSPQATLDAAPVIDGSFVQMRRVVRHPNIDDSGVAYLDGADLVRLLSALPPQFAYRDIPELWRGHVPRAACGRIASWLWDRRVLVPAASLSRGR